MFYCEPCAHDLNWPKFGFSIGACEMCGNHGLCSDVPSKYLSIPTDEQHLLVQARKMKIIQEEP